MIDIDALAQEIRRVDGNHELGAGALAEALAPFITAAIAAMPAQGVGVKKLEWVPVVDGGRDIQSITQFGTYTISVDSSFAGGRHYLWTPSEREYDDDHHSEHGGMTSARAAAQADYAASIMAAIEPAPSLAAEEGSVL